MLMKNKSIFVVCVLLLLMVPGLKAAQPAADENSALRYLLAICYMPEFTKDDLLSMADVNDIESFKQLSPKLKKKLPGRFEEIDSFLENAVSCRYATFLPGSYSWNSTLPPYRTFRGFARYLLAVAWKAISEGDFAKGTGLIIHTMRLAQNIAAEGPVLSAMIAVAITDDALDSLENLLKLNPAPEIKETLKNYFFKLPAPYVNFARNLEYEKSYWTSFLKSAEESPEILVKLPPFKILATTSSKESISSETMARINEYMKSRFFRDADETAALGNEISRIMVSFDQDSQKKAAQIQDRIKAGANMLAKSLLIKPGIILEKGIKLNERINRFKLILGDSQ